MGILFISNDICFEHKPSGQHPERPDRLSAVLDGLERARMGSTITKLRAEPVDENLILQVHDQDLIYELKEISEQGGGVVDADTRMSSASLPASYGSFSMAFAKAASSACSKPTLNPLMMAFG